MNTSTGQARPVAIVGAGLAGLAAASALQAAGREVVVFEKSRGAGGRTATRRGPGGLRFDHGAPFLHDGDEPLHGLAALAEHRLVLPDGSGRAEVVGEGSANAPAKALAESVEVRTAVRVGGVARAGTATWDLTDEHGAPIGEFAAVIITAPAPQAAELLRAAAPTLADRAGSVAFEPCWSVMAAWDASLDLSFTAASGHGLTWAVSDGAKPAREAGERWVLQADAALSTELIEQTPEAVGRDLLARFTALAAQSLPEPSHLAAHRWLYSRPRTPLHEPYLQEGTLLAAGDWCGGRTAGDAVRSGRAAAAALLS